MTEPSFSLPEPATFDKFTDTAQRALRAAPEQARTLHHTHVGTEHLLLGLLQAEDARCSRLLQSLHVSVASIRERVLFIIGTGKHPVEGDVPLTPAVRQVLRVAADEARRSFPPQIDCIHLLLGLAQDKKCVGGRVLQEMGCTTSRIRKVLAAHPLGDSLTNLSMSGAKTNVVTCRLDDQTLDILDTLVEAGIRPTRSDAVTWLIRVGLETNRALVERVYATVGEIRRLRQEALGLTPPAEPEGTEDHPAADMS